MNALCARRQSNSQYGLTLIEILVVVAIISIVGLVATPLYQGYTIRTKISSGIATLAPVQRLSTEYFILNESWPSDNAEAGANTPDTYAQNFLTSVAISETPHPGSIILTYDNSTLRMLGNSNTIIYYPVGDSSGHITWRCDEGTMVERYRPANCR